MLQYLVDFRDYCYVRLVKHEGEIMADWWHKVQLMGFFALYYYAFLFLVAGFMNRAQIGLPAFFYSQNILMVLFSSLLTIVPYILLFLYLFRKMSLYPINTQLPAEKYKRLSRQAFIHILVGSVLCFLIPWGSNKLIPPVVNPPMYYESSGK